jgi:hypothetical protein
MTLSEAFMDTRTEVLRQILQTHQQIAQQMNRGPLLGGFGIKPFAHLKNRERPCEGYRQQNPRNSGFHFHPPVVAFWRAPFVATEAINTDPT